MYVQCNFFLGKRFMAKFAGSCGYSP